MAATRIINKYMVVAFWRKTSKNKGKEIEVKWRKNNGHYNRVWI